ncbi:MAG: thioredoxin [Beijerinckiaceae bacterium]|nr:thioredoxin [Beijerinckiaceae bacterium]
MIPYTNPDDFRSTIATAETPVLVQFSADWCGPCRAIAPLMNQAADAYAGRVQILKIDLDACKDIAEENQVTSIPALILFKHGVAVERFTQARTLSRLSAFLDQHLGEIS